MQPSLATLAAVVAALSLIPACDRRDDRGAPCEWRGRTYSSGAYFDAGDGCNTCECLDGEVACSAIACVPPDAAGPAVDAGPVSCAPSGSCVDGPSCGGVCCDQGEQCVDGACSCGGGAACAPGDVCTTGVRMEPGSCGGLCCGATAPCPP